MAKSKRKVGRGLEKQGDLEADSFEVDILDDDVPAAETQAPKGRRPRREMRERIEVRAEERLLTRELSDWDSYQDDLDSDWDGR
jgi:hypothetical protein